MPRVLSFDVGLKHLAYADVEFDANANANSNSNESSGGQKGVSKLHVHRWGVINVWDYEESSGTSGGTSEHQLVPAVLRALDEELMHGEHALARIDHVLIENQPTRKNPMMKSVQVAIHAFFAMQRLNGLADLIGTVHLVCPGNKLCDAVAALVRDVNTTESAAAAAAAAAATTQETKDDTEQQAQAQAQAPIVRRKAAESYRERKALSVSLCRRLVEVEAPDALSTLLRAKKRDDLADALLQAVWFWQARLTSKGKGKDKGTRTSKRTSTSTPTV